MRRCRVGILFIFVLVYLSIGTCWFYLRKHFRVVHSSPNPYAISFYDLSLVPKNGNIFNYVSDDQNVVEVAETRSVIEQDGNLINSAKIGEFGDESGMKLNEKENSKEESGVIEDEDNGSVTGTGNSIIATEGEEMTKSYQEENENSFNNNNNESMVNEENENALNNNNNESMVNEENESSNSQNVVENGNNKESIMHNDHLNTRFPKSRNQIDNIDDIILIEKKPIDQMDYLPTSQSTSLLKQHDLDFANSSFPVNNTLWGEEKLGILYHSMQIHFFQSSSPQPVFLQHQHSYPVLTIRLQPEKDWSLLSSQFFSVSSPTMSSTSPSSFNETIYHQQTELLIQSLQQTYIQTTPFQIPQNQYYWEGGVTNRRAPWLYLKNVCFNPKSMVFSVYQTKLVHFPNSCRYNRIIRILIGIID